MELFELEQKILKDISECFPYSFNEVNKVYQRCCSFDKTIKILVLCQEHIITTDLAIDILEFNNRI